MLTIKSGVLLAAVLAPLLTALVAYTVGARAPRLVGRLGAAAAGAGFLASGFLAVAAAGGQPATAHLGPAGLTADRLAVVLLLLVFGVSAVVQAFAVRYLAGDPRAAWFTGGAGLLTFASAGLMTVDSLLGLAVFWTLAGLALCLLLGMYWHLPAARDGVRRTAIAFGIGDLALWTAVILVTAVDGPVDLRAAAPAGAGGITTALVPLIGVLVVLAALSRSGQIPFHRWLPATLAAPTPVSALLHAGVVNAGGILLIRLAPLTADDAARVLTILAGAATMAYGALIMLVKPDIKGSLVNSTTAQMGFMILTCGLGLWAAAVIHLVAHGFYKATLFLSSGSAIAARRRADFAPPAAELSRTQSLINAAASIALPVLALAIAVAVVPHGDGHQAAEQALLLFAVVTGAAATWGWLRRRPGLGGALSATAFLVPASVAYVAIINGLSGYLAPSLPPAALGMTAVWVIVAAALAALALLAAVRWMPGAQRLRDTLYTNALSAGHIGPAAPAAVSPVVALSPAGAPAVTPSTVDLTGARS